MKKPSTAIYKKKSPDAKLNWLPRYHETSPGSKSSKPTTPKLKSIPKQKTGNEISTGKASFIKKVKATTPIKTRSASLMNVSPKQQQAPGKGTVSYGSFKDKLQV